MFVATYPTSGGGRRVAIKGSLVYIADGADGLRVLDVSTPSKATVVGAFKTPSPARGIAVTDSLVFVALGVIRQGSTSQEGGEVLILRPTP